MIVSVASEVARIARALGRELACEQHPDRSGTQWRVVQRCPICGLTLVTYFETEGETVEGARLHRELFALYDGHRCVDARTPRDTLQAMLARTDAESARIAARARELEPTEAALPDELNLFVRAEREFVVLAEWMTHLERLLG